MTQPYHTSNKDDWGTPWELFNELDAEFHFALDACADEQNKKCVPYFSVAQNGLFQDWKPGPVFVNPPYSQWDQWVAKAEEEREKGVTSVLLLASRTDTVAFHKYFWDKTKHEPRQGVQLRFLKGRLTFQGAPTGAPFPSLVVVMFPYNRKDSSNDHLPSPAQREGLLLRPG